MRHNILLKGIKIALNVDLQAKYIVKATKIVKSNKHSKQKYQMASDC